MFIWGTGCFYLFGSREHGLFVERRKRRNATVKSIHEIFSLTLNLIHCPNFTFFSQRYKAVHTLHYSYFPIYSKIKFPPQLLPFRIQRKAEIKARDSLPLLAKPLSVCTLNQSPLHYLFCQTCFEVVGVGFSAYKTCRKFLLNLLQYIYNLPVNHRKTSRKLNLKCNYFLSLFSSGITTSGFSSS